MAVNHLVLGSNPSHGALALSSNGLGQRIFVPFIGVRIPVGSLEIWQSGLMQRFTKPPTINLVRGFESYNLRKSLSGKYLELRRRAAFDVSPYSTTLYNK